MLSYEKNTANDLNIHSEIVASGNAEGRADGPDPFCLPSCVLKNINTCHQPPPAKPPQTISVLLKQVPEKSKCEFSPCKSISGLQLRKIQVGTLKKKKKVKVFFPPNVSPYQSDHTRVKRVEGTNLNSCKTKVLGM